MAPNINYFNYSSILTSDWLTIHAELINKHRTCPPRLFVNVEKTIVFEWVMCIWKQCYVSHKAWEKIIFARDLPDSKESSDGEPAHKDHIYSPAMVFIAPLSNALFNYFVVIFVRGNESNRNKIIDIVYIILHNIMTTLAHFTNFGW